MDRMDRIDDEVKARPFQEVPMPKIQRFQMSDLLVVLVCLGLLLWLGMGCYRRSTHYSYSSNCTGQLKQLGAAGALYTGDNAGSLPGPQPWGPAVVDLSWDKPIALQMGAAIRPGELLLTERMFDSAHPAVRTLKNFTCPQDPEATATWMTTRSYSENLGDGLAATGIEPNSDKIPVSKVLTAAGTAWLVENYAGATGFGAANAVGDTALDIARVDSAYDRYGHDLRKNLWGFRYGNKIPRVNVLMHDGHVELLRKDDLSSGHPEILKYVK